jgi:hypothetical protein
MIAADVFVDNDVFLLHRARYAVPSSLGAVGWLFEERPRVAHQQAFVAAASAVTRVFPNHVLWLLAAHTALQPDTPIARHRKLWSSLRARHLVIPTGTRSPEFVVSAQGGARWFGAVQVSDREVSLAVDIIESERASMLVAVGEVGGAPLEDVLRQGWAYSSEGPPPEIVEWLTGREGLAFWPVGDFDDRESGVVAFGPPSLVVRLDCPP